MSNPVKCCCPNENCSQYGEIKNWSEDEFNEGRFCKVEDCKTKLIRLTDLPDPAKIKYSFKQKYSLPGSNEKVEKGVTKTGKELYKIFKKEEGMPDSFYKDLRRGEYDDWVEKSN